MPGTAVFTTTIEGKKYNFTLNKELTNKLKSIGHAYQATVQMTLLTVLNILLYKYPKRIICILGDRDIKKMLNKMYAFSSSVSNTHSYNLVENSPSLLHPLEVYLREATLHSPPNLLERVYLRKVTLQLPPTLVESSPSFTSRYQQ